jgi:uncharacterized repeat protein (TIGR01451 family)
VRLGKRADRGIVHPGGVLSYRISYRNAGSSTAYDVKICDRLPAQLSLVSASGARLTRGQACWHRARVGAHGKLVLRLRARVTGNAARGRITNVVAATARNAKPVTARATVRVRGTAPSRPGGVTG